MKSDQRTRLYENTQISVSALCVWGIGIIDTGPELVFAILKAGLSLDKCNKSVGFFQSPQTSWKLKSSTFILVVCCSIGTLHSGHGLFVSVGLCSSLFFHAFKVNPYLEQHKLENRILTLLFGLGLLLEIWKCDNINNIPIQFILVLLMQHQLTIKASLGQYTENKLVQSKHYYNFIYSSISYTVLD